MSWAVCDGEELAPREHYDAIRTAAFSLADDCGVTMMSDLEVHPSWIAMADLYPREVLLNWAGDAVNEVAE